MCADTAQSSESLNPARSRFAARVAVLGIIRRPLVHHTLPVTYLAQAALACFITALLIVWLRRPAQRFRLVDHPDGRKRHGDVVPLTGGLAITIGFFAALSLSFGALGNYFVLFVAVVMLAAIGVLDDLHEISPRVKLGVQVVAAVFMTSWASLFLVNLGDLLARGPLLLANWGIPLTVFAVVAVINGINMLDGLDGLAGGLVLVMLAFFAGFAWWAIDPNALKLLAVLIGAVFGFLMFNAPHPWHGRRRTFMGDTGSLVLGFAIAWFAVELSQRPGRQVAPVVMLWVTAVVLFDVFTVTVRRLIRRRDPAAPDRAHLHHLLLRRGMSPRAALCTILLAAIALAAVGTALWQAGVPDYWSFATFLAAGGMYLAVFLFPGRFMRITRRRSSRLA